MPTLLVFHSPRCGPCQSVMPHVRQYAKQGALTVQYFDTSTTPGLDQANELNVRSTPTLLVVGDDGFEVKRTTSIPMSADKIGAWARG